MEQAPPETGKNNFFCVCMRETSEDATAAGQNENFQTTRAPEGLALLILEGEGGVISDGRLLFS